MRLLVYDRVYFVDAKQTETEKKNELKHIFLIDIPECNCFNTLLRSKNDIALRHSLQAAYIIYTTHHLNNFIIFPWHVYDSLVNNNNNKNTHNTLST